MKGGGGARWRGWRWWFPIQNNNNSNNEEVFDAWLDGIEDLFVLCEPAKEAFSPCWYSDF